jgi:SSS family solute:Na+ symporter
MEAPITNLHTIDLIIVCLYMGAMVAMGFYFSRKNDDTEEYFLGGRRFSGWAIGLSMMGTAISSITFLGMPADAFKTNWIRYITYFGLPIAVIVAARYIVPIFRSGHITSVYEYLENRFGPSVRVYGSLSYILAQLIRVSMVLYLLALLMHEITGIDEVTCVVVTGIFVGLYTIVGGIDAVIWTDVFQTIILALGSLVGLFLIITALPGGVGQIFEVGMAHDKFSLGDFVDGKFLPPNWSFTLSEKTASMIFLAGVSFFFTEYLSSQHMVQRYCAAKTDAEAKKGLYVNLYIAFPVWTFYMLFGTALFVYFMQFPAPETTAMLDGSAKPEGLVPYFILNHMPPGLAGLLLAAAMAAGMSSLDSSINAVSTVSTVDIYKRHLKKNLDDHHYLVFAKTVAAIVTALMIGGAYALIEVQSKTLQDTAFILTSLVTGGMLGLFVLGLLTTRGDARAVWVGILFTVLFTLWTILQGRIEAFPEARKAPFDLYYTGMLGNLLMFIVGYGFASLLPGRERNLDNLTVWTMKQP